MTNGRTVDSEHCHPLPPLVLSKPDAMLAIIDHRSAWLGKIKGDLVKCSFPVHSEQWQKAPSELPFPKRIKFQGSNGLNVPDVPGKGGRHSLVPGPNID